MTNLIFPTLPRLNTINTHLKLDVDTYDIPKVKKSDYVVDDSSFVPIKEAIKQLGSNGGQELDIKHSYDFADGKDTGMSIPVGRMKSIKDIAEISATISEQTEKASEILKEARKAQQKQKDFEKSLSEIKTTPSGKSE